MGLFGKIQGAVRKATVVATKGTPLAGVGTALTKVASNNVRGSLGAVAKQASDPKVLAYAASIYATGGLSAVGSSLGSKFVGGLKQQGTAELARAGVTPQLAGAALDALSSGNPGAMANLALTTAASMSKPASSPAKAQASANTTATGSIGARLTASPGAPMVPGATISPTPRPTAQQSASTSTGAPKGIIAQILAAFGLG